MTQVRGLQLFGIAAIAVTGCVHNPRTSPAVPIAETIRRFEMELRPVRGSSAEISRLDVHWELNGPRDTSGRPFSVRAAVTYASVSGIADSIFALEVHDIHGEVATSRHDDPADRRGFPYYRHWTASRRVDYPVVVSYSARPKRSGVVGPQFALLGYAGGVSGAGSGFLVLPEDSSRAADIRVRWNLSGLAPGAIASSTFGASAFGFVGAPTRLMQGYYMAGPLGRYPERGSTSGFTAFWLGVPPFDPVTEMAWTARMYSYLRTFFRDTTASSFAVFVRVLPGAAGYPGTALENSFLLGTPARHGDSVSTAPRETLTHEMVHHWALGIQGTQGSNTWFHEGLAVFYARLLPMRAGLDSVGSYGRSINATVRAYFANPLHNLTADSIGRMGFSTGVGGASAQNVPYTRGSLYFADVDAQIRAASGGRRKLDDILLSLFARIKGGERVDQNVWVAELTKEIGPSARAEFDSVIVRGKTIVPSSNAFGPCFERRPATLSAAGQTLEGFEWVRVGSVLESRCREW